MILNSYFDMKDFESPIKTYLDARSRLYLLPNLQSQATMHAMYNTVEAYDDLLQVTGPNDYNFYSVERVDYSLSTESNKVLAYVKLELDDKSSTFYRQVYSFLDLTGQIGGVNEVLMILGTILTGLFTETLFNYSILSSLYQVDTSLERNKAASGTPPKPTTRKISNLVTELSIANQQNVSGIFLDPNVRWKNLSL